VNHLPQVFEYQYRPAIVSSRPDAPYEYLIAGRSCLAGDLFGEYRFATPLEIGSIVTFSGVGSYTLVKSQMFNGINLPTIYFMRASGELEKIREYGFSDFWSRSGGRHGPDRT
jgi:carboxynorspermidine decarboxylase